MKPNIDTKALDVTTMGLDFSKDYRAGFEVLTSALNEFFKLYPEYKFHEFTKPNGEIERWWRGGGESIVMRYRRNAGGLGGRPDPA